MRIRTGPASVCALLVHACLAFEFPRAQNVTWKSTNFKTLLTWGPPPTDHYSYTVEFSRLGGDQQRNPHCVQTPRPQCDLSMSLSEPSGCYTAYVVSQPPSGAPLESMEYPYTTAPPFCPSQDTLILGPTFRLDPGPNQTTVHVTDPPTAVFRGGAQLSLRDVFGDQLEYQVVYRRNKSTGKKEVTSRSSVVEVKGLERGQSYCFQVRALIRSRPPKSQLGKLSQTQCTPQEDPSLLEEYSVGVVAGAILLPLLLVGGIVAVIVICCRRKREEPRSKKEVQPLNA